MVLCIHSCIHAALNFFFFFATSKKTKLFPAWCKNLHMLPPILKMDLNANKHQAFFPQHVPVQCTFLCAFPKGRPWSSIDGAAAHGSSLVWRDLHGTPGHAPDLWAESTEVCFSHSNLIKSFQKVFLGKGCSYASLKKRFSCLWQLTFLAEVISVQHSLLL